ncbi:MAG: hypothetical protein ACE5IJ_06110 [Thermoplasmata archaeon]
MRTMDWERNVWQALKSAVTEMPIYIRKRALRKIIEASEENAKRRNSKVVQAPDLVVAARENVPESVQDVCLNALRDYGVKIQ